ncbi:MAG: heavy metal translocating P-type ATPase [Desulfopila sp.]
MAAYTNSRIVIVHELDDRLRLCAPILKKRGLDIDYFEAQLEAIEGVTAARINTRAGSVVVEYAGRSSTRNTIVNCLDDLPRSLFGGDGKGKGVQSLSSLLVRGGVAAASLLLPRSIAGPLVVLLTVPVVLAGAITLLRSGIKVPVLDGAAVLFCLVRRDYFTASSIVFLLYLAEYLEELSENRTTGLLKSLLKPQVERIWIEVDGQEREIAVGEAKIGDRVVCGAGELIPLDGIVVSGEASINTSSITGESVPAHVKPGDEVLSGSVVEDGRLVFSAKKVGRDTSMARISAFLENSLRYQSESQKKSDELADRLVPLTFGLGLGLLVATRDLTKAAAVLTVDYSCVVKLANPVAVRVAMFTAARQGVLLKGAQAMDSLARADTMVFDKTGTLTQGRLAVTDLVAVASVTEMELLACAASAEEHYAHPVAAAVVDAARQRGVELEATSQVDFIVAHGVSAYINGENVLVGSRHFIEDDEGISCRMLEDEVNRLQNSGKSILYVAKNERLIGIIGLRDALRHEAVPVLAALKRSGIKNIVILTGDAQTTAKALAARLPAVDTLYAELKPEDKARIVKELQQGGHRLAFVGDGVNDAPALVSADVGICLPGGADLAKESAQVILLQDNLSCLLAARLTALRSQRTIQHSFVAAVGLNSTFLLLASFGMIMPYTSALLHNLSTVSILGYAAWRGRKEIDLVTDDEQTAANEVESEISGVPDVLKN